MEEMGSKYLMATRSPYVVMKMFFEVYTLDLFTFHCSHVI